MSMRADSSFYPEVEFGGFTDIDGTIAFYNRVNALIQPTFVVLDLGCGRGGFADDPVGLRRNLRIMKGKVKKAIGVDVDPEAAKNPFIDEFHLFDGARLPVDNDSIDLIICDNVLEHVAHPDTTFSEARRVLKDGGYFCIRTPNAWNYVPVVSRILPQRYHKRVLAKADPTRAEQDIFPAYYRCNTIPKLRSMLARHGMEHVVYGYEAEPSYLAFSRLAYRMGVMHQRLAPRFMKPTIFAFGRLKKGIREARS